MSTHTLNKIGVCRLAGVATCLLAANMMPKGFAASDSAAALAKGSVPPAAVLAAAATQGSGTAPAAEAGVFSGKQVVAFVFKRNDRLWLGAGDGTQELGEVQLPGSFVQSIKSSPKGIAVKSLVSGLDPMILVATSDGASIGSYLNVYSFRNWELQSMTGVPVEGAALDVDCTTKAVPCRLLAWGRWTDLSSATVMVYEWNGSSYVRDDADADGYVRQKLEQMSAEATDETPAPPRLRTAAAQVIIPKYVAIHEPGLAVYAADQILKRLDDPASSLPPSTGTATAQKDLDDSKAAMHELKAMGYRAQGRQADADGEVKQAQAIHKSR